MDPFIVFELFWSAPELIAIIVILEISKSLI